ncbi:Serine/threonine-protein kinase [Komagataella phaffii CBS 7435]|uniref:Serine/threonine-protein kinase SCH9 n=2 Tax=Komagataella phaffii TaxID=460519 RepID=C4R5W3_KOMPG|nr:uncharacterized protein PAS_chr3_0893 [Komagataella phaffii GS115]AOA64082.1 GQ67_04015T0 [Komagataella phaffii]CAH2449236.1 Serine/threonine-protein kinase [Komagataella phaffii CBS 7435]AOA68563.1 GQ68_03988T0 [Komagataella phaffii GS115]CAY70949.1 Protein kinase involved in transcriptional activation of osmostress-responsive genes [Komagataella phaffii GS115]CCA39252.1 Serine/threonine-protein kinase [Komagataella phaffii CBS 7435]
MSDFAKNLFGFGKLPAQKYDQGSKVESNGNPITQFPNILQTPIPTTAVSKGESIYGTTTTLNTDLCKKYGEVKSNASPSPAPITKESLEKAKPCKPPVSLEAKETSAGTATDIPRGKLRVSIEEAQCLNISPTSPSLPYVVCTFESTEFITHGPESISNGNANTAKPVYHRQSSSKLTSLAKLNSSSHLDTSTEDNCNPIWHHQATFDVIGASSELDISVYDEYRDGLFLGHVRILPKTIVHNTTSEKWLDLHPRVVGETVTGKIKVKLEYFDVTKRQYGPEDFEVLRLLGKGTFGQVYQVRKKDTKRIYAMKVLSKKVIVRKKEIAHTIGERDILVTTASTASPFIVGLKFSFQTPSDLYLVTDYMSGGELFWHLQKEGRFSEERAKFYIAELVLSLEHLHDNDIVYRDLKPENILLDANGHIALCDFGLSKANLASNGTTNTFCGTTEYLAPEVLLDESGYTKMVDFWSLGVLIFEMCCGWSPFYAENTQQMYKNIAFGKVKFPKDVLSSEGRSFVKGLLNRNPRHRLGAINDARELRDHPFFNDIDWALLKVKKIPPPFKPHLTSETDTSNFDPEFTNASTSIINKQVFMGSTPLSPAIQANFKGFTYVDESAMFDNFSYANKYKLQNSYRGTNPVILGNPNNPDEDVIEEGEEEDDDNDMDIDGDHHMDDDFVNGQFDL